MQLDPSFGNVAIGSGLHGWGFTLRQIAAFYADRLNVDENKLLKKLWGDNFYNSKTKKWSKNPGEGFERGFNKFVLEPIYKVLKATLGDNHEETSTLIERLGIKLTKEENELTAKEKMKVVMRKWLPAGDAMVQIIVLHLPSPARAQKYRAEILYEGPMDDPAAQGTLSVVPLSIRNCLLFFSGMVNVTTILRSKQILLKTRMHSSRMRTARSSSRPGGVSTRYPPQDQKPPRTRHPPDQAHPPWD